MRARNLMGHLLWWRPGRAPTMIGSVGRKSPWGHGVGGWVLGVCGRVVRSLVRCSLFGEEDRTGNLATAIVKFSFLLLQI